MRQVLQNARGERLSSAQAAAAWERERRAYSGAPFTTEAIATLEDIDRQLVRARQQCVAPSATFFTALGAFLWKVAESNGLFCGSSQKAMAFSVEMAFSVAAQRLLELQAI